MPARPLRVLGIGGALILLLAGCGVQPTTAASVQGAVISTESVDAGAQARLSTLAGLAADNPTNRYALIQAGRTQLTSDIQHTLLARTTPSTPVDEATVQQALTQSGAATVASQLGVTEDRAPQALRDFLGLQALLVDSIAAKAPMPDIELTISGISYPTEPDAYTARTSYLADPASFDTAVTAAGAEGGFSGEQLTLQTAPKLVTTGIYSAPTGSLVVIPNGDSALLVRIEQRALTSKVLDPAVLQNPQQGPDIGAITAISGVLLAAAVPSSDVEVNPRYGVWDPVTAQVVPAVNGY